MFFFYMASGGVNTSSSSSPSLFLFLFQAVPDSVCVRHFHLQRWQAEISPSLLMDMLKIKKEAEEEDPVNQWASGLDSCAL